MYLFRFWTIGDVQWVKLLRRKHVYPGKSMKNIILYQKLYYHLLLVILIS